MASSLQSEHQREREWLTEMYGFDRATLHHDLLRLWGLGGYLGQRGVSERTVPYRPTALSFLAPFMKISLVAGLGLYSITIKSAL